VADPVVDTDTLRVLDEETGDIGIAAESVELYLAEYDVSRADLTRALEQAEASEVARIAHRLKSSSAMVGAFRLAKIMADLEHAAASPTAAGPDSADAGGSALRTIAAGCGLDGIWDRTQRELQAYLRSSGQPLT